MSMAGRLSSVSTFALLTSVSVFAAQGGESERVQYGRDIQPILAQACFNCHGPDAAQREARLRLDEREGATAERRHGSAIIAGDSAGSLLVQRIIEELADDRMPPPEAERQLSSEEIALLVRWVEEGAEYETHWAFLSAKRPPSPLVRDTEWARDELDTFILRGLEGARLNPSAETDKEIWLRRVTLDLTGLPPQPEELAAFVEDDAAGAFERVVDRLLASPHYAEHMARYWLDMARYADSHGYQYDQERQMWAWRDWVIEAYTENMPFDTFTVEQIAGDLLESSTESQRVATGFNRNHPITIEGGVIDEEYRVEYVMDRVGTTATTWMGLTVSCARCHDHKYDPLSQREFYGLYAFFNQVPERGFNGFDPLLSVMSRRATETAEAINQEIAAIEAESMPNAEELAAWVEELTHDARWHPVERNARWHPVGGYEDDVLMATCPTTDLTGLRIEGATNTSSPPTLTVHPPEGSAPLGRYVRVDLPGREQYLSLAEVLVMSDGENIALRGKATQSSMSAGGVAPRAIDGNSNGAHTGGSVTHTALQRDPWWEVELAAPAPIHRIEIFNRTDCCSERLEGCRVTVLGEDRETLFGYSFSQTPAPHGQVITGGPREVPLAWRRGAWTVALEALVPEGALLEVRGVAKDGLVEVSDDPSLRALAALPLEVVRALEVDEGERSEADRALLAAQYIAVHPSRAAVRAELGLLRTQREATLDAGRTSVMVMSDQGQTRPTHVLAGGQYNQPGELVEASVPAVLPGMATELPANRLGLARWLTSAEHPLTARVAVNRYWQRLFGRGLVETLEDFGTRGARPSHPELLDYLALEFVESGWDVQAMLKRMVLSATYRQESACSDGLRAADPENRLFSRAPRLRLDAEAIRDQALAISKLLDPEVGGASVYPYQPAGLWMEINNRPGLSRAYPNPAATGVHRRSLYTYWKRTLPPPSMQVFDAPSREACTVLRSRTSTPLQALTLMHDPQFVEAARAFGLRILRESEDSESARIEFGFRVATGRAPSKQESAQVLGYLRAERARFEAAPEEVERALGVGITPRDEELSAVEQAAWMSVGRLLLNLDEVIHRS
jgi:hypothetical protein